MKIKDILDELKYMFYTKGIRRLIPKYQDRTIFTKFYWRTLKDRWTKGFDETALWSLDWHLTKLIAPRLRAFRDAYIDNPCYVPGSFLWDEQQKSMKKGYKWDSHWSRLADKAENKRCWKRAIKEWSDILTHMCDAFDDMELEGKDWDAWNNKWKPIVDKNNKKLDKAKTLKEKEIIWNSFVCPGRKYREGLQLCTEDIVYNMREAGKYLFMKHYGSLWT